jgi:hypothetical protein
MLPRCEFPGDARADLLSPRTPRSRLHNTTNRTWGWYGGSGCSTNRVLPRRDAGRDPGVGTERKARIRRTCYEIGIISRQGVKHLMERTKPFLAFALAAGQPDAIAGGCQVAGRAVAKIDVSKVLAGMVRRGRDFAGWARLLAGVLVAGGCAERSGTVRNSGPSTYTSVVRLATLGSRPVLVTPRHAIDTPSTG